MVDDPAELSRIEDQAPVLRRSRRWRVIGWVIGWTGAVLALVMALAWFNRAAIVDRIISGQLASLGLPGKYRLESAGLGKQVLTHIVIGNPARPDLTIERAEVWVVPAFGLPTVGKVMLLRPRLYGTIRQARASFGSLDTLLFGTAKQPRGLPDLELELIDGRARLLTDYGTIGLAAHGRGNLSGGFAGVIAAAAPQLDARGCRIERTMLSGRVAIASGRPQFSGPLQVGRIDCPERDLRLADAVMGLDLGAAPGFDRFAGRAELRHGALGWGAITLTRLAGRSDFSFAAGDLTARYRLVSGGLNGAYANLAALQAEGLLRSRDRLARVEVDGSLRGGALSVGAQLDRALTGLAQSGAGTLVAPLAAQLHSALAREVPGSQLVAGYLLRADAGGYALTIPHAALRGASGAELIALSRFQLAAARGQTLRLSGNFATAGQGLPRFSGRIERNRDGSAGARLTLAAYRTGDAAIALPQLVVAQAPGGEIGFSGRAELSGAVPGGRIDGLVMPLDGNWSARRGLAVWRRCIAPAFHQLTLASMVLDRQQIRLCPGSHGAILRSDARGIRIAAGTRGLALTGHIATNPVRIATGPIGVAWPGAVLARDIAVELGERGAIARLRIGVLHGRLGKAVAGTFADTEARLAAVPLDVVEGGGAWQVAGGDLTLSTVNFRLKDRQLADRFRPLLARDGLLHWRGGVISGAAMLREPGSDRSVVHAAIVHDLISGQGHADLSVPGLVFDAGMQPDTLSALALGVIANARGTVTGTGRIDWRGSSVTSTGTFSTSGLDFAAAFGPTRGVSGTVAFSDLIGLVTQPDQRLRIASINPGVEVTDGELSFQLLGNNVLAINGARWPFIDGTLELLPTRMVLGASEVRRYTLRLRGANAALFVHRLDLGNLSASGVFDGDIPIVFDQEGGHVVGGKLVSRPPGGNVSYVGELTYKDLSPMANAAFQSLRSLDYRHMEIGLDGNLDGEIVTRLRFDGVSQGAGAKRNIATRAIRGLPIQFNVNIRAPFQKLISSLKSLYDPNFIADPRTLGLIGKDGRPPPPRQAPAPQRPIQNPQPIQPSVSRIRP